MEIIPILILLLVIPFTLFMVWLAISSCLGNNFRARFSNLPITPRQMNFGRSYGRGMGSGVAQGGWEHIEMEDMIADDFDESDDDRSINHGRR